MGLAFLITTDNLQLLGERKVLKEAEYAALLDAGAVVEAARGEAARIVAQAELDALRAREAGHAEGLAQAQTEYAQRLVTDALATQRQLHGLRHAMAAIVVRAVGEFMAEAEPQALIASALHRVEALIRAEPFITMRVAPGFEAALRQTLARLGDSADWALIAAVVPDPTLPAGGCVVATASGTLEIGLDAQLDAFRKAIERGGGLAAGGSS
jgi:type III secretion protein L